MDKLDTSILKILYDDVKAPYAKIAKQVKTSKEVVKYRIERLEKDQIILGYHTIFGFDYWAYKILADVDDENLEKLQAHHRVTWLTPCSGQWNTAFSVMAKNPKDFQEQWNTIQPYIDKHTLAISTGSTHYGFADLHVPKTSKTMIRTAQNIESKDNLILNVIRLNARMKIIDIYKETKIPTDTIIYRIKRMEKLGIIRRYRLILNSHKLNLHNYELFISAQTSKQFICAFKEFCNQDKRISFFGRLVGDWNIELTVHLQNSKELRQLVLDIKKVFAKNIQSVQTVTLFETKKYTFLPDELL